jgi:ABC-2 type transport system permease protein
MLPEPCRHAPEASPATIFWRTWAMLVKEFIQLRRDRVSFAMIIMIPLLQLIAVWLRHQHQSAPSCRPPCCFRRDSDLAVRSWRRCKTPNISTVTQLPHEAEVDNCCCRARFCSRGNSANFERAVRRGDRPAMLVAADGTDPVASGTALSALGQVLQTALSHDRDIPERAPPFEIRTHARYNPAGLTQLNIVPGLVGTILTMTMLIFTALSVTREIERGTMETLLSMPITPIEIMLGKIVPYVFVGFVQAF